MKRLAVLTLGTFLLAACPSANSPVEDACKQAIEQLEAEKAMGTSCPVARARVQSAFPSCKLVFLCKGEFSPNGGR
jgi:hypothetical protein